VQIALLDPGGAERLFGGWCPGGQKLFEKSINMQKKFFLKKQFQKVSSKIQSRKFLKAKI
jgi:hypothetical protein